MSSAQVNRPTNVASREADINQKLQLYGILTAFQNGKVPSNEQIDVALNSFIKSRALSNPSTKLSAEGRGLVADFRNVVEQAKHLLLTKNEGNLLQDFIWQAQQVEGGNAASPTAPVGSEQAKQHGNEALSGLRTLGTLVVTNGQFRKLLSDATILIRDIAGDAATKAATKVKPSEEQLAQIDRPAEDDTWHDAPDLSASKLKNQFKSTKSQAAGHAQDAAGNASAAAHPDGSRDVTDTVARARKEHDEGRDSAVDVGNGAQAGISTLRNRASENIPDETKESARERKERTKQYLSNKMPQERRDQTIWRLRKMVVEIQGHPDYLHAIDTLLYLAETYAGHAGSLGEQTKGSIKGAHTDSALKYAEADIKLLIERFANGTSSQDLFDSINTLYRDAEKDPQLKSWFQNVDTYIRKCLKQQGYIMEDRATDEWNELYDRGNFLLRERYRNHTDRIVDEVKFLADQFDRDAMNQRFSQSVQKLFNDLGNDEYGKATFKPHLLKDLTEVIIPGALRSLHYVPIPRIEYSDPAIDAVVENLVIESDNLMPNIIEIANDNYFRFGRKTIANKNANSVSIHVSGIQMDLRDVSYYVKRKQGSLKLTDLGVMDIYLGGSGFSFKLKLSTAQPEDRHNFFRVDKVDVDVQNFNIKVKKSKHKALFSIFKPLMIKLIRPGLQKVLEKQIKDQFTQFDALAYEIKKEADRTKREVRENPEDAPNIYQRYVNAAQKQAMQGKKKTEKVVSDKKVNVAMTQHDSIFPNIKLPGGISTKATEYKELAKRGEKWESPVFALGSAAKSTNIAGAPQVTQKSHHVTQGGVRDAGDGQGGAGAGTGTGGLGANNQAGTAYTQAGAGATTIPTAGATAATTGATAATTGATVPTTTSTAPAIGVTNGHTLLGAHNPVFNGQA